MFVEKAPGAKTSARKIARRWIRRQMELFAGAVVAGVGAACIGVLRRYPTSFTSIFVPAFVAAGVVAGAFMLWRHRERLGAGDVGTPLRTWLAAPAGWHWLWLAALPPLAVALVGACVPPGMLWTPDEPHGYDVVAYHFQVPREWYELGRIVPLKHNVFSYFPFGAGTRICVGEQFAWMEGTLVLATIAQRWQLRYAGSEAPVPVPLITLRPRGGMPMRLQRRRPRETTSRTDPPGRDAA